MLNWGWQNSHLPSSLPSCSVLQLTPSPEMTKAQWSRSRSFRAFGATQLEGSRGDWILPVPHRQPHLCSRNAVMWFCRQLSVSAPRGQGLGTPFPHPPWSFAQLMLVDSRSGGRELGFYIGGFMSQGRRHTRWH